MQVLVEVVPQQSMDDLPNENATLPKLSTRRSTELPACLFQSRDLDLEIHKPTSRSRLHQLTKSTSRVQGTRRFAKVLTKSADGVRTTMQTGYEQLECKHSQSSSAT